MPLPLIGLGLGVAGAIGDLFGNKKANRKLEALIGQDPSYKVNPIAGERLDFARQLLKARTPGMATAERNIYANQGTQMSRIARNATDSSQLLALGATSQAQTNQSLENLGMQESQDYYNRLGILNQAQEGMINEGDKVYQDQVRRFEDLAKIRGAQNQNRQNTWQGVSNMGFGLLNFGLSAGY